MLIAVPSNSSWLPVQIALRFSLSFRMPTDFYNIDSALSEEERAVRDTIRSFVDENVLPIIGDCYIEGRFPKEIIPQMAELGMFGANLPEEYGCAGLNNVAYGLIMHELERGDSG